jgi:primosomal protein N' (replication factor Y)
VLAPAPDLGVIVVDDEHNPAFKEDRAPRFDARAVALSRARARKAACIFVSPAPSLEAATPAIESDSFIEPARAADRPARPVVEVVERPRERALSRALHRRVTEALRAGGRVALLAPRRGFARAMWCAQCRRSVRCPVCESALSFDRGPRRVRCPRCAFQGVRPERCPSCGAADFRYMGAGSERLAQQIAASWPTARVAWVDPDYPGRETGGADVYVTTWFGTKPALRPNVSFVAVVDADALIHRPDFRASERAYQALSAMAEWAGPAASGGRLLVQTSEHRHHAIQAIARADYRFFYEREMAARRELNYPPFCELVKISSRDEGAVRTAAETCRRAGGVVLGPITVPAASGARSEILVKCDDALVIADALRPVSAAGAGIRIDVDPR